MNSILVAGNILVDHIKRIPAWPNQRSLVPILSMSRALGGLAPNVSIDLARLDPELEVQIGGCIGADTEGEYVRRELGRYANIDQSGIRTVDAQTAFTDVMTVDSTGERTFFSYPGANALMGPEDFDFGAECPKLLHLGYILLLPGLDAADAEHGTQMAWVLAEAQKAGVATSVDVVSEEGERACRVVTPALQYADYCTLNEVELECVAGTNVRSADGRLDPERIRGALQVLQDAGVRRWVTMHAPEGAWGLAADGTFLAVPSLRLRPDEIRSSVGAGDAFVSGVLYGVLRDQSYEQALELGNVVAALSLAGEGASDGIPTYAEAERRLKEVYGS